MIIVCCPPQHVTQVVIVNEYTKIMEIPDSTKFWLENEKAKSSDIQRISYETSYTIRLFAGRLSINADLYLGGERDSNPKGFGDVRWRKGRLTV